jgi:5-methylthioadenosine/S-adenosylhomocysteine deaminase
MAVLRDFGALKEGTQLLHCNHLPSADLKVIKFIGATMTLCASSAAAKQTGYSVTSSLGTHDMRISVGTDWGQTDMLAELKFLRQLPGLAAGAPSYSSLELLRMATINGAHALGLGPQTGSLEIGKTADLILLSLEAIGVPAVDGGSTAEELAEALVDHLTAGDITDVMTEGVFRIRNRRPTKYDLQELQNAVHVLERGLPRGGSVPAKTESVPFTTMQENVFLSGSSTPAGTTDGVQTRRTNLEPPAPPPPQEPVTDSPEVSKKIRKVFGEDDY